MNNLSKITSDRNRTNILKRPEQCVILFLVSRIPSCITPNMLTAFGFLGGLVVVLGMLLGKYINKYYLILSIFGLAMNWFGDSLDGRLAYYRDIPRKWYGFTLDFIVDWLTVILIGCGYIIYLNNEVLGFGFIILYSWAMMLTLLAYKLTDQYLIDAGSFAGPTEGRILLCIFFAFEIYLPKILLFSNIITCIGLLILNTINVLKLLKIANNKDNQLLLTNHP